MSADSCWVNVFIQCLAFCRKCDIEIEFIICFCSHVMFSPKWCVTVSSHNIWGEENKKCLRGKSWNYKAGVPRARHKQFEFSASFEIFLKPSIFSSDKGLWTTTRFSMFFFVGWKIAHIAFHIFFLCFDNCKSCVWESINHPVSLSSKGKMKMTLKSVMEALPFRGVFALPKSLVCPNCNVKTL